MTLKSGPDSLALRGNSEPRENRPCQATTASAGAGCLWHPAYVDPIYRISKLAAATRKPLSVSLDTKLEEAVTRMLTNDFSQLPVMTSERDVKGVITWASIGSRLAIGKSRSVARELMEQHQEIRCDASLVSAIGVIAEHQYVLREFARFLQKLQSIDIDGNLGQGGHPKVQERST